MENNIYPPLFLVGEALAKSYIEKIEALGFKIILMPSDVRLPLPTKSHTDMLLFSINENIFCNKVYFENNKRLFEKIEEYGYNIISCDFEVKDSYPFDVSLNQAQIGKYILGNRKACAKEILAYATENSYEYISIKQGYAKCSTLILNKKAIITADDSIEKAAKELNIEVLKISNGANQIKLDGYDYGFIGGASAVYEKTVFFFGDISLHKDGNEISNFCKKHGFSIISLSQYQLEDIGGAFILPYLKN